jgi:hypothetical protein
MPHLPLAHHETNKHDFPHDTKIKVKLLKYPGFEFKSYQVNDSSQSNQGTDHLVSQSSPWWVYWQQKTQSLKFKSKTPWSTTIRPKSQKSSRRSSRRRKTVKASKNQEKRQNQSKWERRAKKSSKSENSTLPLTLSMQALPLR